MPQPNDPVTLTGPQSLGGTRHPSAIALGLALTLSQIAVAWLLSLAVGTPRGYLGLCHWDSAWYERIINEGYHSPENITVKDAGTAGFFPGYPLAARLLMSMTGLAALPALLVTAQLCCWGFWTYVLLLCRDWNLSRRMTAGVVLVLLAHPVSFYLVAAYSESMLLMSAVGYFYWSTRPGAKAAGLAAAHGFALTATRLVGVPLVIFPVVRVLLGAPWRKESFRANLRRMGGPVVVACLSLTGVMSFFLYCQVELGHWD